MGTCHSSNTGPAKRVPPSVQDTCQPAHRIRRTGQRLSFGVRRPWVWRIWTDSTTALWTPISASLPYADVTAFVRRMLPTDRRAPDRASTERLSSVSGNDPLHPRVRQNHTSWFPPPSPARPARRSALREDRAVGPKDPH